MLHNDTTQKIPILTLKYYETAKGSRYHCSMEDRDHNKVASYKIPQAEWMDLTRVSAQ